MSGVQAPLVMLHALGATGQSWSKVSCLLSAYRVISPDLPGHGGRPLPQEFDRIEAWADEVVEELSADGVSGNGGMHLVGMSLGGLVAANIASRWPRLVKSLVLVGTVPTYPPSMRKMWKERAASIPISGMASILQTTLELWFTPQARNRDDPVVTAIRSELSGADPHGYAAACSLLSMVDLTRDVGKIKCPTSVVYGQEDSPVFREGSIALAGMIAGAESVEIASGRHAAAIEKAEAFAAFLSGNIARNEM